MFFFRFLYITLLVIGHIQFINDIACSFTLLKETDAKILLSFGGINYLHMHLREILLTIRLIRPACKDDEQLNDPLCW